MKITRFISYVLTETPKLKEFFSYVKHYEYQKFFKNQVYLFFQPLSNIYKNSITKDPTKMLHSKNTEQVLEMHQSTFEVVNSLLVLRIKFNDYDYYKKSSIEESTYIENGITNVLSLVNQEFLLNRMRKAVA